MSVLPYGPFIASSVRRVHEVQRVDELRIKSHPRQVGGMQCILNSPMLRQLHWLPVRRRVDYKVACLVHQSLAGQTPACLADDIQLVTDADRRPLRTAAAWICFVPRTQHSFGDRSFSAAGPRVWNSLPPHLRQDMNFARFQHKLKTFLFRS